MPFTHVEIEERKSRNIALLLCFLVLLYFASLVVLWWGAKAFLVAEVSEFERSWSRSPTPTELLTVFGISLALTALHWMTSMHRLFERVKAAIGASPPDAGDTYHAVLTNIVQEVSVATGGRAIEGYVINTPAVNACAFTDFDGRAAIAVTEGALALLSRAQLESVIGHEAAHVVSGDSVMTSMFCGLFALHEEALKRIGGVLDSGVEVRGNVGGRLGGMGVFVLMVLQITMAMKKLCEMLISREKEYRADAVAVRLTRNPVAMAEALHLISRRWRGVGTRGESLSSIFIMETGIESLSEREGVWASLFSTHPPTERRIQLLLGMAHLSPDQFAGEMATRHPRSRVHPPHVSTPVADVERVQPQWMLWSDGQWVGPVGFKELMDDSRIIPETWVRRVGDEVTQPAHRDPRLLEGFRTRYASSGDTRPQTVCPNCQVHLISVLYEGTPIETCPACHGCYVDTKTVTKVFAREEYALPASVIRRGDFLLSPKGFALTRQAYRKARPVPIKRVCPRCRSAVVRKWYTESYPVQVEQCWSCSLAWLDAQELELLQYLYEKRQQRILEEHGPDEPPPHPTLLG